jgi:hypothetical protein
MQQAARDRDRKRVHAQAPTSAAVVIMPPPSTAADGDGDSSSNKRVSRPLCAPHGMLPLDHWCNQCKRSMCAKCTLEGCRTHSTVDMNEDGPVRLRRAEEFVAASVVRVAALRERLIKIGEAAEVVSAHRAELMDASITDAFRIMRKELYDCEVSARYAARGCRKGSRESIEQSMSAAADAIAQHEGGALALGCVIVARDYQALYTNPLPPLAPLLMGWNPVTLPKIDFPSTARSSEGFLASAILKVYERNVYNRLARSDVNCSPDDLIGQAAVIKAAASKAPASSAPIVL